jgi:hypothetical protein
MAGKSGPDREKSRALGKGLKAMFRALEKRPVPERLEFVLDQLVQDAAFIPVKKTG